MGKRSYERLSVEDFGRQLIVSKDLDPIYVALWNLRQQGLLPADKLSRWLIAYWCFYHAGVSSYLSEFEGMEFWDQMEIAARNEVLAPNGERWHRGSERRHFRGVASTKAVDSYAEIYGNQPEMMVDILVNNGPTYKGIADRAQVHKLFGPWISFKVADMLERVIGVPVDFDNAAVFMFKDPVKAALMVWRDKAGVSETAMPKEPNEAINLVVQYLTKAFGDLKAPPAMDRLIGLQEVETVLCKWKSHMNGHYPLFNDIDEIREGLPGWGDTAAYFLTAMPEGSS